MEELKKTGFASFIIAVIGVIVPLIGGVGCYMLFYNDPADSLNLLKAGFVGVVLTATSVSITVETLRELGKLKSKVGTAILGAAVIDDILGIVVLTILTAFTDPSVQPVLVFGRIVLFFVFVLIVGLLMHKAFLKMEERWHKHRRIAIYALVFAFLMSYAAEKFFGIADITGAYFAGIVLCNISEMRDYVASKTNVLGYMLFSPLFFASIGIKTNLEGLTGTLVLFAVLLTVVAILSKIIGCGLGARIMGFQTYDSFSIGLGMISRGEVALIVAQKGAQANLIDPHLFPAIVLVVIVTTLVTPILLKSACAARRRPYRVYAAAGGGAYAQGQQALSAGSRFQSKKRGRASSGGARPLLPAAHRRSFLPSGLLTGRRCAILVTNVKCLSGGNRMKWTKHCRPRQ